MARQLLTFIIVFLGIFLLTKSCSSKPPAQDPVRTEPTRDAGAARTLRAGPMTARLAEDGTLLSLDKGDVIPH
jgi:hypothetical protein